MNSKAVAVCTTCRLCGWGRGKAGFSRGSVGVMLPPAVQLHCGGTNCASLCGSVEPRQASEVIMSLVESAQTAFFLPLLRVGACQGTECFSRVSTVYKLPALKGSVMLHLVARSLPRPDVQRAVN